MLLSTPYFINGVFSHFCQYAFKVVCCIYIVCGKGLNYFYFFFYLFQEHFPSFMDHYDKLKAKGVTSVNCVSVNDPFVMAAFCKHLGAENKVCPYPFVVTLFLRLTTSESFSFLFGNTFWKWNIAPLQEEQLSFFPHNVFNFPLTNMPAVVHISIIIYEADVFQKTLSHIQKICSRRL